MCVAQSAAPARPSRTSETPFFRNYRASTPGPHHCACQDVCSKKKQEHSIRTPANFRTFRRQQNHMPPTLYLVLQSDRFGLTLGNACRTSSMFFSSTTAVTVCTPSPTHALTGTTYVPSLVFYFGFDVAQAAACSSSAVYKTASLPRMSPIATRLALGAPFVGLRGANQS